jgi:phosphoglycolate phosphatase-like HAD superfamily hydrolase
MKTLENITFSRMLLLIGAVFTLLGLIGNNLTLSGYKLPTQDTWARIMLIILGLILGGLAIYFEAKSKPIISKQDEEKKSITKGDALSPHYDKFSKISEWEFLDKIDLSKVSHLYILGHTGQNIYIPFRERLEKLIDKGAGNFPEEIRILIRAPIAEGLRRNHYIHNTTVAIGKLKEKHKNINVRFYESVPAVRGIICKYRKEKTRDSYITSYYWPQLNSSKAFDFAYISRDTIDSPKPETGILESWIDQYWGKDEIHTIVFDFDDTLVKTRDIQVKAWAQVIIDCLDQKIIKVENLSSKFQDWVSQESIKSAADPILLETIKNIFMEKQLAEAIAQEIFVGINDEAIKQINKKRFEIRMGIMDKSELFDGVSDMLAKLQTHYSLAIISSTDEQLISKFLKDKDLLKYFPVILGKRDPSLQFEREKIHHKASLLIKLSELIGMPLNRLVYIGDNNSDYLATQQLGVAFIEARQAAKLAGRESIITDIDPKKPPLGFFESFESEKLLDMLRKHSESLSESKYQIRFD